MYDAIIIGGGIVGMSTAYHLVRDGARVLLVDRADVGKATLAGAGILLPETSSLDSSAWYDLATAAVDYYPALVAQLDAEHAGANGFARVRALVVAVSADEDVPFRTLQETMTARRAKSDRPALTDVTVLDANQARRVFPPLGEVRHAMLFEHAGRVDGRLMTAALRTAALGRGLEIQEGNVSGLIVQGDTVKGVVNNEREILSGAVVIAGGAWSGAFAAQLGIDLSVKPQRGQIIHLSLPGTDTSHFPIIVPFRGHYMVPWQDERIAVGATREWIGFKPHITAAGVRDVLSEALRVAPGLADATIAEIRVGLRPGTPDNLPVLGPLPTFRNIFLATGHGATGLQLGPYSGKLIAELVRGAPAEANLDAFSVGRFVDASGSASSSLN